MQVLVRLPNWLGDVVMSAGFVRALHQRQPQARLHLVTKAELAALVPLLLPPEAQFTVHAFAKKDWPGPLGAWRYGRQLRQQYGPFEQFYALPNSFSAALLGLGSGARQRLGYAADARRLLLTRALPPPVGLHRADVYVRLLAANGPAPGPGQAEVRLTGSAFPRHANAPILLNFNSEAQSRRMPVAKAAALTAAIRAAAPGRRLALLGSPRERGRVAEIQAALPPAWRHEVENQAGQTDLPGLAAQLAQAALLVSTDSGPAHVAHALGTPVLVFFGPGHERETGPYRPGATAQVLRCPGPVPCGGCRGNRCRFGDAPPCLTTLDEAQVAAWVRTSLAG